MLVDGRWRNDVHQRCGARHTSGSDGHDAVVASGISGGCRRKREGGTCAALNGGAVFSPLIGHRPRASRLQTQAEGSARDNGSTDRCHSHHGWKILPDGGEHHVAERYIPSDLKDGLAIAGERVPRKPAVLVGDSDLGGLPLSGTRTDNFGDGVTCRGSRGVGVNLVGAKVGVEPLPAQFRIAAERAH